MQQQQKAFTDFFGELWQCMPKPMIDLTRLNFETFNHLTKNPDFLNSFMQAKKPDDILTAQMKCINAASIESFKYM